MFKWNFLYFSLCPLPLILALDTTEKGLAMSSLLLSRSPLTSPFSRLNSPSLLLVCQILQHLNPPPVYPYLSYSGEPRTGPSTPDVSPQCWAEGKYHLPQPAGNAPPNAAQEAVSLCCCKGAWLACGQLVHHDHQVLHKAAFKPVKPQCVLVHGIFPSVGQDFALPFKEFHEVPLCPFLQPVKVPLNGSVTFWCISHSSELCIVCELAEGALHHHPGQ